ncbi:aldo/keto reductase [Pseudomonas aeruginosa]|nr:aldo/keto reductase [Pseudomonas aeruginosa]
MAETHRQTRPHGDRQQGRDGHGQWPQAPIRRLYRAGPERSLRRLQTDYLDLYQSHTDDPHTDLEETLPPMAN